MRFLVMVLLVLGSAVGAVAQGAFSDIMSGALINPEVGAYAWYEIKDSATDQRLFMRQAIIGRKQVAGKTGYYLETEVMPEIGFPIVYRMLLTGAASDPANVHEIKVKDGSQPVETVPTDLLGAPEPSETDGERTSLGMETVTTPGGDIEAERFSIVKGTDTTEVWINDKVRPMGIVKMVSREGELLLSRYGVGGPDAESTLERKSNPDNGEDVTVRVVPGPTRNFRGRTEAN